MRVAIWIVACIGCGTVKQTLADAPELPNDGTIDAGAITFGDMFLGPTLDAKWSITVGAVGAFSIVTSPPSLHFTNAGVASDFLRPGTNIRCASAGSSNLDSLVGNQLAMPLPIGTNDFSLEFKISWNETDPIPQSDQYGLALTDAQHHALLGGTFQDGSSGSVGSPGTPMMWLHDDVTSDWCFVDSPSASGSATIRFTRKGGRVDISINNVPKSNPEGEPFTGSIAAIAVVNNTVGGTSFPFDLFYVSGQYQP